MRGKLALFGGAKAVTRTEELAEASRWPVYSEQEKTAVLEAMDAPNVYAVTAEFERDFAGYCGSRYALAHCNGSAAIHAACFAVGVQPGDEVITSAYTWHLQVDQILALHAIPVFCDIHPRTACIEPEDIRRKISPRTRAIIVVHPFGCLAPMDDILAIAEEYGLPVIEDCSHAHGATYKGHKVGTMGDIGVFSFQASKLMNAIEGGILITDNETYYERAVALAHYDRIPTLKDEAYRRLYDPAQEMAPACFGFKYRMHPLGAAIARVQLRHLDEWNAMRRANHNYLTQRLNEVGKGIFEAPYDSGDMERIWLNYICQYHAEYAGFPRETFLEALCADGLPATGGRAGYLPVYWNPIYSERIGIWGEGDPFDSTEASRNIRYMPGLCPVAEVFWKRCINLPMLHRAVSQELLDEIVEAVDKAVCNLVELQKRAYPSARVTPATPKAAPSLRSVAYAPPAPVRFETERITDTGGWRHSGGTGRSCWGYHQSNIVRYGDSIYALCWRDDTHLTAFRRVSPGMWETSPLLPKSPQSGALLVDAQGRLHLIAGDKATLHLCFEPPGQVQQFTMQALPGTDTRFGAAIAPNGDIFIAGGVPAMRWLLLSAKQGYAPALSGCLPHPTNRAYYFAAFDGTQAQVYCTEIHYLEAAGFQTTQTYHYCNPDLTRNPDDWRLTIVSDVSDTFDGRARGTTGNEDLLVDRKGRLHLLAMRNVTPATGAWAAGAQDHQEDELIHTSGMPGEPLAAVRVGQFSRGRLCQTADGRLHYLMTRREEFGSSLWHAIGSEDDYTSLSEPVRLDTPGTIDHLFVNNIRAGGTLADGVDIYFTGPYPGKTGEIWYGRLESES
jgi:perosamine synthetase